MQDASVISSLHQTSPIRLLEMRTEIYSTALVLTGLLVLASSEGALAASMGKRVAGGPNKLTRLGTIQSMSQEAYLKASNTNVGDAFGSAVALSGNTLVIGAPAEDSNATGVNGNESNNLRSNSGAVYVFVRSGSTWMQEAYLKASNTGSSDQFGATVGISGDTIVVGAPGEDSDSAAIDGDGGNDNASGSGAAYVFSRNGGLWSQQAYLKASNASSFDGFGISVAISGDHIVVGALGEDSDATGVNGDQGNDNAPSSGCAYVFVRNGSSWSQQAYLKASNTDIADEFGSSVAISGDTIIVGARDEDSAAVGVGGNQADNSLTNTGAAYVFVRTGATWAQQAYLKASNADTHVGFGDLFGISVAISHDTIVVGAIGEDSGSCSINGDQYDNTADNAGAAYVFRRLGTNWFQESYLKASNCAPADGFAESVAIDGNLIVVGSRGEDGGATGVDGDGADNSAPNSGAAYAFSRIGSAWRQTAYVKASNTGSSDRFGQSISVYGHRVLIGAPFESSSATGVDGDQGNNLGASSGAGYLFVDAMPGHFDSPGRPIVVFPVPFHVAFP